MNQSLTRINFIWLEVVLLSEVYCITSLWAFAVLTCHALGLELTSHGVVLMRRGVACYGRPIAPKSYRRRQGNDTEDA